MRWMEVFHLHLQQAIKLSLQVHQINNSNNVFISLWLIQFDEKKNFYHIYLLIDTISICKQFFLNEGINMIFLSIHIIPHLNM